MMGKIPGFTVRCSCAVLVMSTLAWSKPPPVQLVPREQGPSSKIDIFPTTLDVNRTLSKAGLRSRATAQPNERLSGLELEVRPPERADYRESAAPEFKTQLGVTAVGPGPMRKASGADGAIAGLGTCAVNDQCQDCSLCTTNECIEGVCALTDIDGTAPPGCDDGLACNGLETCEAGVCTAGTPVVCPKGEYCVNSPDIGGPSECVLDCTGDGDCDDGLFCTDDKCNGGVCEHSSKCGPGALDDCLELTQECPLGRCCSESGDCSAVDWATCGGEGSDWLATANDACVEVEPSDNINGCPGYASGVAPQGTYTAELGPVSNLSCDAIVSVGDDYQMDSYPEQEFFHVEFLRFAAGTVPDASARYSIAFHDAGGLFIEDVFWPDGTNLRFVPNSLVFDINTVAFDPPLTIPTRGFVVWSVQGDFTPDGRVVLLATDAVDVGNNNVDVMWLNGAPIGAADAGPLAAGSRVLAFELVGEPAAPPLGACCTGSVASACVETTRWVCEGDPALGGLGGYFLGGGVFCSACSGSAFLSCRDVTDCPGVCDNDLTRSCTTSPGCLDDGNCVAGFCYLIPPVCETAACCTADGSCASVTSSDQCEGEFQGFGTDCSPNCCEQAIWTGRDNCGLVQNEVLNAGRNNITIPDPGEPPITVTITGHNGGATFDEFGNYTQSGIFDPDGSTRDPGWWEGFRLLPGTDSGTCANVRIDLCCSRNDDGEVLRPAWSAIWKGCGGPRFDVTQGPAAVDPPIGLGHGTFGGASRGGVFCDEDNLWMTFANLRPGDYYYPLLSYPGSSYEVPPGGQYQLHVTVGHCPAAACCLGEVCVVTSEIECDELGGYWLGGDNVPGPPVESCGTGTIEDPFVCAIGACCTGPGQCEDRTDTGKVCNPFDPETCMDKALCDALGRDYVGGAMCSYPTPPCPICEIGIDTNTGCTRPDLTRLDWWQMADLSIPPDGNTVADDFVASGSTITTACAWGMYLDVRSKNSDVVWDGSDCSPNVTDDFRIRIYLDVDGRPGPAAVCESKVSSPIRGQVDSHVGTLWPNIQMYEYQLPLDTHCEVLIADSTYWIEIVNNTVEDDRCGWRWYNSAAGNQFSANGTSTGGYPFGSERFGRRGDQSWCIDQAYTAPALPLGECCDCEGNCTSDVPLSACSFQWNDVEGDGDPTSIANDLCVDALPITGDVVTIATDTTCAETEPSNKKFISIGASIWYEYTATCTGRVTANMCGTGNFDNAYDSMLGVYRNPADPKTCACPGGGGGVLTGGWRHDMDEGCDGIFNAGSGILQPPSVTPGDCLLVRVGGYDEDGGRGLLSVGCIEDPCLPSKAPEIEVVSINGVPAEMTKVRNLAFSVPDSGERAVQVTFDNLPPPFDIANGSAMWVTEPREECENGGQGFGTALGICASSSWLPTLTYKVAQLQCTPLYRDWSGDGVINVYGELIVPSGTYSIRVVETACSVGDPNAFSDPLTVTTPIWGDLVEYCEGQHGTWCAPPNGSVDVVLDVVVTLGKFGNTLSIGKARADMEPGLLDGLINISDVTFVLGAFRGDSYPFAVPELCPSDVKSGSDQ